VVVVAQVVAKTCTIPPPGSTTRTRKYNIIFIYIIIYNNIIKYLRNSETIPLLCIMNIVYSYSFGEAKTSGFRRKP